jgi:hypothetical protein
MNQENKIMKKLLVIPILLLYYLLMLVLFPIEMLLICICNAAEFVRDFTNQIIVGYDVYLMEPLSRINSYALDIMNSDKIMQQINEASKKLKQGKPID